jgi:two-component system invasion response regulator UvrY
MIPHSQKKRPGFRVAKVLIADDHAIARAGYRQFLELDPGIHHLGEASSGSEVLDKLRAEQWDLVLLDINMPDRSGLDILRHVSAQYPNVSVLVLSGLPEEIYALAVLRSGARGYLSKSSGPDEMLRAIRQVLAGRRYVSTSLAEIMANDIQFGRNHEQPLHTTLSTREFQIFCKLAAGLKVSAIGSELSLSVKTVSTYRARVLEKMALKTNADIIAYALRSGLIQ